MAKLIVEEQKEFTLLPEDTILLLKVDELKEVDLVSAHGPWTKLEIKFKIMGVQAVGGGGDPSEYEDMIAGPIWGSVPLKLTDSPENKLRQWAEAIFGVEMGVGFELDTELFLSRQVRGVTSQYKKKDLDSKGNPVFKHQIGALLPVSGGFAAAATQPVPAAAADPWATPAQPAAPANDPWAVGSDGPGF